MAKIVKKVGIGRFIMLSLSLLAVIVVVALFSHNPITAADMDTYELQTENAELRQILDYYGRGPVDVYSSLENLGENKPTLVNVKPMRPAIVFGKHFYRFRDNEGDIVMISPSTIAAIRVSAENNPAK